MPEAARSQPPFDAKKLAQEMIQHDLRIAAQRDRQMRADDTVARQVQSEERNPQQFNTDRMLSEQVALGETLAERQRDEQSRTDGEMARRLSQEEQAQSRGALASMIRSIRQSFRNARSDTREGMRALLTGEEPYQRNMEQRYQEPPPAYGQHQQDQRIFLGDQQQGLRQQPFVPGQQQGPPGFQQFPQGQQQFSPQPNQFAPSGAFPAPRAPMSQSSTFPRGSQEQAQRAQNPADQSALNPAYQRYAALGKTPEGEKRQIEVQNAALKMINSNPWYQQAFNKKGLLFTAQVANDAYARQATSDRQKNVDLLANRAAAARGLQPGAKRKRAPEGPENSANRPAREILQAHGPSARKKARSR